MKTIYFLTLSVLLFFITQSKAQNLHNLLNTASGVLNKSSLSNDEIIKGLKEALNVGTNISVTSASKTDGFYRNTAIKVLFPPEAQEMERKLRSIGMGTQCDKFIETLNRSAEEASKTAATIFIDAITGLTISDGLNILKGADNSATLYLQSNTTSKLKATFSPIVRAAMSKVQLTKYWEPLANKYNKIPFIRKVNPDLEAYVTEKTIEGLFKLIATEEYKIRKDPKARINDILQKVFGAN